MEKITFHITSESKDVRVRYRLRDGRNIQLCHTSDILAKKADLDRLQPDGTTKDRVSVYNRELAESLKKEYGIMKSAYALIKDKGMDITTQVFECEIAQIKNPVVQIRTNNISLVNRFRLYADDALKHGIVGENRHKHILVVSDKLERFLLVNGISGITPLEFTDSNLWDFRDFLFDEYKYVSKYPKLYADIKPQNLPKERLSMNTVASQMKMFQTFFTELEDTEEISRSPFRKLGRDRRKTIMKTRYDDPIFLRREELFKIMKSDVPDNLQDVKDAFLLQCAFGCRISDFQTMSMDTIAVSDEGIPYVHYVPKKTADELTGNEEVVTPIVRYAFDIIKRTGFNFPILRNVYGSDGYNVRIKYLLRVCGINRMVPQFNEETKTNDYIPLYQAGSSKLCRKTHVDMANKVQVDMYAAGLHKDGSTAVKRYTKMELKDRFVLLNAAFDQKTYRVNKELNIMSKNK